MRVRVTLGCARDAEPLFVLATRAVMMCAAVGE